MEAVNNSVQRKVARVARYNKANYEPIVIRFKRGELAKVREASFNADKSINEFIRSAALEKVIEENVHSEE